MVSRPCCLLLALAIGTVPALVERRSQVEVRRATAPCSCECCSVVARRWDERTTGASVKCARADGHSSETCSEQCTPTPGDKVLGFVAESQVLDYSRFCFYECKPADGVQSLVSTKCLALDSEEASRVVDSQGDPMDPAFLYAKRPEEAKKQRALADEAATLLRMGESGDPQDVDRADAHETALDGRSAAQAAVKQIRKTLGKLHSAEAANAIPDLSHSDDPLLLAGRSRSHAARAQELADKAEEDAEQSIEALKSGRNETWMAAMWSANKALNSMRRTDYRLAIMHETAPKPWRALASYASRAASAPYLQTAPALQQEAAYDAMRRAKELREKAESLDAEGDILKRRGLVEESKLRAEHAELTAKAAQDQEDRVEDLVKAAQQDKKKARKNGYWADAKVAASTTGCSEIGAPGSLPAFSPSRPAA
eukprot:TRINITY_DN18425_c0_g1_i1.p1 TRINITY_DN18425_c0_g1~~TRINITY_DN18425_c0_g1_i1.p1  ORF type:complete len:426 (-),score=82.56 TRINITY_DN18425_c0_g1_i1:256-1533(-)